ncbi:lytic polysaccharide monooxygenase [Microbulbifer sp. TYP-18]|uniref:lytic polysaccharide monooxygenase n=1 Tax=Microbulbifer sp. TYP-18 TaxID=3230024 RepID=UPI0034C6BFC8
MLTKNLHKGVTSLVFIFFATQAFSHGYVESPPSRQQHCGVEIKPDNPSGTKCNEPFANYLTIGGQNSHWYNFMSVLVHNQGRKVVKTTKHVCGFDSETWNPMPTPDPLPTPWDTPADWPTTSITSGPETFVWDITYGPHFSDTEEFVFYITRPEFTFDANRDLDWNDFEAAPFCDEQMIPGDFSSNPNISADLIANHISVNCNIPVRSGRHVIFAEWGRNEWTFERFFSCIDVTFE